MLSAEISRGVEAAGGADVVRVLAQIDGDCAAMAAAAVRQHRIWAIIAGYRRVIGGVYEKLKTVKAHACRLPVGLERVPVFAERHMTMPLTGMWWSQQLSCSCACGTGSDNHSYLPLHSAIPACLRLYICRGMRQDPANHTRGPPNRLGPGAKTRAGRWAGCLGRCCGSSERLLVQNCTRQCILNHSFF